MQSMAGGLNALAGEILGPQPTSEEEAAAMAASGPRGLANELRQYMKEKQDQEEKLSSLHDAIQGLVQQIRDEAVERSPEGIRSLIFNQETI